MKKILIAVGCCFVFAGCASTTEIQPSSTSLKSKQTEQRPKKTLKTTITIIRREKNDADNDADR